MNIFNKKSAVIFVLAVIILLAFLYWSGSDPEILTIMSDDGSAKLEVPKGALPEGVLLDTISVSKYAGELSEGEYARYALLPEGTTFTKPVTLVAVLNITNGNLPVVMHEFGDAIEELQPLDILIKDNATSVTVELTHFSDVSFKEGPFTIVTPTKVIEREVDSPFPVGLTISVADSPYYIYLTSRGPIRDIDSPTYEGQSPYRKFEFLNTTILEGRWFEVTNAQNPGIIAPLSREVSDVFDSFYNDSVQFTCEKVGGPVELLLGAKVSALANLSQRTVYPASDWGEPRIVNFERKFTRSVQVKCLPKDKDEAIIGGSDDATQPISGPSGEPPAQKDSDIEAEVIFLNGQPYYAAHFYSSEPHDTCSVPAWYTARYDSVLGWESRTSSKIISTYYADEEHIGCGFGSVAENPAQIILITAEQAKAMSEAPSNDQGFIEGCHHTCQ